MSCCAPALNAGLAFIRLATPTTDDVRLPAVLANASGFRLLRFRHWGDRGGDARTPRRSVERSPESNVTRPCRSLLDSASKTHRSAAVMAATADGVAVGSAIVEALRRSLTGGSAGPARP